jgi:steroid delta-isomerase-like uncharacterized protein
VYGGVRLPAHGPGRYEFKEVGPTSGKGLVEPLQTYGLLRQNIVVNKAEPAGSSAANVEGMIVTPEAAAIETVARRWHSDIFEAGRMNVADEILGPGFVLHMPDQEIQGPDETKQLATALRAAFPDLQITQEDVVASGNKVAIRWTARGTHRGPYPSGDVKITGREIHMRGIDWYEIDNGKIVKAWMAWDELGVLRQLGTVPTPRTMGQ